MKINFLTRRFYEGDNGANGAAGAGGNSGAGNAAAGSAGAGANNDWTAGFSDDHKAFVQTKGYKSPTDIIDSYRGVEKLIGQKERILLKPERYDDKAGYDKLYNDLGRPGKPEEYTLEAPKEADPQFLKWAQDNFHKNGLSNDQAKNLVKDYLSFSQVSEQAKIEANVKAVADGDAALKKEWGAAYEQNKTIAQRAVEKFGITQESLLKIEASMTPAESSKLFHMIGSKLGEGEFVRGEGGGQGNVMTPSAAQSELNRLSNENGPNSFSARFSKGDQQTIDRRNQLLKMAYPDAYQEN